MATLTNAQVVDAFNAAHAIAERKTLAVKAALACRRLLRALTPLVDDLNKVLLSLADAHGEKDANGELLPEKGPGTFKLRPEAKDAYKAARRELMDAEVPVECWVTPAHFEGVEVTGAELMALGDLLREDADT
jgi:hypothetical protein